MPPRSVLSRLLPAQMPIQLAAQRFGLPRSIGLLMVGWGLVAACFAGLTSNPLHLYGLRFLLGAMEAGAFPWSAVHSVVKVFQVQLSADWAQPSADWVVPGCLRMPCFALLARMAHNRQLEPGI